jgi:hypothetical protein
LPATYTAEESARLAAHRQRSAVKPPKLKRAEGSDALEAKGDHGLCMAGLAEALGTADTDLITSLLNQAASTVPHGKATDVEPVNRVLAALHGIAPRDELEGMLAVQMVGVHNLAMECMRRAVHKDQTREGVDANVNRATKLLRTFAAQVEALNRLRGKGQQRVTVEHVHVHRGGQAIVGEIRHGGGGHADQN